jgi:hypothetical protein
VAPKFAEAPESALGARRKPSLGVSGDWPDISIVSTQLMTELMRFGCLADRKTHTITQEFYAKGQWGHMFP